MFWWMREGFDFLATERDASRVGHLIAAGILGV